MKRSLDFNPFYLLAWTFAYMLMHDGYFYFVHWCFHISRPLYKYIRAMHHGPPSLPLPSTPIYLRRTNTTQSTPMQ
jgi:sterol desaturase/sphingolipid hydroxylase (fatty acid hydroxylase superfamily)